MSYGGVGGPRTIPVALAEVIMGELIRRTDVAKGVSTLLLDRADRRNALSIGLLTALCEAIGELEREPVARVVILRGAGPVFSAGLDLAEASDDALVEKSANCVKRALATVQKTPLIVIAAVQGGAFAGGAGLMAACDLAIAAQGAKFGFPEARRGLLPALICEVLRYKVREGDLRDLFLTGEAIGAARAREIGLVQRVVPEGELEAEAERIAREILAGGPETIRATKRLLNGVWGHGGEAAPHNLSQTHLEARRSPEAREGLQAFLDKRPPNWFSPE